jgi:hypothetical protein
MGLCGLQIYRSMGICFRHTSNNMSTGLQF